MSKRNGVSTDRRSDEGESAHQVQQIFVKNLPNSRYQLKKAIAISVTSDQETAIARYENLDSFGLGKDADEAVHDLLNELCDIYRDLEANQHSLGTASSQWWYHLRQIMKRNAND